MSYYDFDLFVIGGGSGGVRAARVAANMGKRVGIAEEYRLGGTCVIRGCVPKKLMMYASEFSEHFTASKGFGWTIKDIEFSWSTFINAQKKEIKRLEGLYRTSIANSHAKILESRAELIDPHTVKIINTNEKITAKNIIIATGASPNKNEYVKGSELCITSNDVFELEKQPQSILIEGGGYIALEFASIFSGLGTEVTIVYRGNEFLPQFDQSIRQEISNSFAHRNIKFITQTTITEVTQATNNELEVQLSNGTSVKVDQVLCAIGRVPNTKNLGLENANIECDYKGAIKVDKYCRTSQDHIFALGDVTNIAQLTPVAIHQAMCVVETLYKDNPTCPDYELIPTAVFTQPEIGVVGLSEEQAVQKYKELDIYRAHFRPMKATLSGSIEKTLMKMIVHAETQRIVGVHIWGGGAAEMIQLITIALKMGAKKSDFDQTMALHPTSAEELVTTYTPSYKIREGVII
jgi:glutathione reductase (NADPH)